MELKFVQSYASCYNLLSTLLIFYSTIFLFLTRVPNSFITGLFCSILM